MTHGFCSRSNGTVDAVLSLDTSILEPTSRRHRRRFRVCLLAAFTVCGDTTRSSESTMARSHVITALVLIAFAAVVTANVEGEAPGVHVVVVSTLHLNAIASLAHRSPSRCYNSNISMRLIHCRRPSSNCAMHEQLSYPVVTSQWCRVVPRRQLVP